MTAHVYPVPEPRALEHMTDGLWCWCLPEVCEPCTECDDDPPADAASCWRCGGRRVVPVEFPELHSGGLLIIHRDR